MLHGVEPRYQMRGRSRRAGAPAEWAPPYIAGSGFGSCTDDILCVITAIVCVIWIRFVSVSSNMCTMTTIIN